MKRQVLFALAVSLFMGLNAKTVYLNTGGGSLWEADGVNKFAAWHWQGSGDGQWSAWMTQVTTSVWKAEIAEASDHVVFCRFSNDAATPAWDDKKYNQTGDLTIGTKNMFKITAWKEDGCEENCKSPGTWDSFDPATLKYYIAGNGTAGNPWCCEADWKADGCPLDKETGSVTFKAVPQGTYQFKITDGTWGSSWGASSMNSAESTKGWKEGKDGNIMFKTKAESDITVSFDPGKPSIKLTVAAGLDEDLYVSSVPAQCPDVLMQGFYWDSYKEKDEDTGTDIYGDTRWKAMLSQADEIGAYFDLVWLPPSALASGTGYYPRQYSNQNSDWGSRADLEKLIATFHNSGTRVVADIVLDHFIAMSGWCEFATMNFGKYGTFTPDMSWVCKGDEINNDETKKKEIGDCYGKATGPDDEGDNNTGARDLAHSKKEVQDFSKAYLQWMLDEMKYDGFRWDEAKGFDPKHIGEYNDVAQPYISFMERWSGNSDITWAIEQSGKQCMALDFQTKYKVFDGIASFNYSACRVNGVDDPWSNSGLLGCGYSRYAVTFIDSHDWFMRNDQEFGGKAAGEKKSMTPELKDRLLQANAYLLSMPGVPCVFYPHWAKYKEEIKDMINARHLAGVHSESAVSDESANDKGYQCTVKGKNGWLILQLGDKTTHTAWDENYKLIAKGNGYAIWVHATGDAAPGIIGTQSAAFEDKEKGIMVTLKTVGGSGNATLYYTTDGTEPTTASAKYTEPLTFKETTVLKVMAVCGTAQTRVQTYTYTYREPLKHGIRVRFKKPEQWEKVYYYAWIPGTDGAGNATSENIIGAYPGQRVYQDMDGWYSYEFDQSLTSVNFCISSGEDCGGLNVRSNDLITDYDADYGWEEGFETESQYEKLLDEGTVLTPAFDLSISPESGNFNNKTEGVRVHINAVGKEGAMVYYSTDGSDPAQCPEPVKDSITLVIKETAIVRAYAYDAATEKKTAEYTTAYTYKEPQNGPITVNFIKPREWEELYLYAFTRVKVGGQYKDTPYSLDGKTSKWPGMKWEKTTTINDSVWHTWTLKDDIKEIYVIFTEGEKKPQTQDIYLTENTCFVWRADCGKAVVSPNCDGLSDLQEIVLETRSNDDTYKIVTGDRLIIIRDGVMYDVLGRRL